MIFDELFFVELGTGTEAAAAEGADGNRISAGRPGAGSDQEDSAVSSHCGAEAGAERNCRRHGEALSHAAFAAGRCGIGQDDCGFEAAIIAIENGYQVALMAPTEILAQQHYFSARRILEPAGISHRAADGVAGSRSQARSAAAHRAGNAQLVIGTHALMEEKVEFAKTRAGDCR